MDQCSGKRRPSRASDPAEEWLDAAAAAAFLGVKRATLYAYVSRGRVRSRGTTSGRRRAYARSDLERLRAHREARAGHGPAAAGALRWGEPVLDTAISEIGDVPTYRGHSALALASSVSFEAAAELLWGGVLELPVCWSPLAEELARRPRGARRVWLAPGCRGAWGRLPAEGRFVDIARLVLAAQALVDDARFDASEAAIRRTGRTIVRSIAVSYGLRAGYERAVEAAGHGRIAASFACALGVRPTRRHLAAIDQALVLCADHGLNASTFACRVAASAGADPYSCVAAGLATLGGSRHGGASERVAALIEDVGGPERATRHIRELLRRGEPIPGFGHPLYPSGDPRARMLLATARRLAPRIRRLRVIEAIVDAAEIVAGELPNLDLGLAALGCALRLPRGAELALFALGRSAGWLAHALEQRQSGVLLRPRARFVGPGASE